MDMKRFFLYAIMIAALALAGCGGNGGNGADPMTGGNDNGNGPDPAAQLAALIGALGDAGLTVTAESTAAEIMAQLTAMSNDARDAVLATIRAALGVTGTQDAMMLASMITDRLGPPGEAPNTKTNAVLGAIVAPSTPGVAATAQGVNLATRPGNAADNSEMVTARPGDNANDVTAAIFVGDPDALSAADQLNNVEMMEDPDDATMMVPRPNQFMPMAGSEVPLAKEFTSTIHERTMMEGAQTDQINVFTNREEPGALSFADYYMTDDRDGVDGMAVVADDDTNGRITIETDESNDNFDASLIYAADFPMERDQDFTYDPDDVDTEDVDENERKFAGMFKDVSGTYECTSTPCTAGTDEDGKLDNLGGTWTFTPDDVKSMIPDVDHDSDYLAFGWWLRSVTDEDDETTYSVGTFATGAEVYALTDARDLVGSATYSGPAGGKYGRKTLNADGTVATLAVGHFTADATLDAYFGGGDVAANKHFTISGSVTDFEDAAGNDIDSGWTVELMKAGFDATGNTNAVKTGLAVDTFGGDATGVGGEWQGRFFGPQATNDPDTADIDESIVDYPTGVAGEFTGHFANGHVIGAFGATKD